MYLSAAFCLALNLYHEARGLDDNLENYAISNVVMNRVKSGKYPDSVCAVIEQNKQFSWTANHKMSEPVLKNSIDRKSWEESVHFANWFIDAYNKGKTQDVTDNALFYSTNEITPWWSTNMKKTLIGPGHTFYRGYSKEKGLRYEIMYGL